MKKILISAALMLLIGDPAAIAQSGGSSSVPKNSGASSNRQVPVGHRQPRVSDVPSEKNLSDPNDPLSRENAALDRKIRSICRGC